MLRPCRLSDLQQGRGENRQVHVLAWELKRIWKVQTRVVPVVIGALGTITRRHKDFLADLGFHVSFETIQKASLEWLSAVACFRWYVRST